MAELGLETETEFRQIVHQVDDLVKEFEEYPSPEVREKVFHLLQAVDALHRQGLARITHYLLEHGRSEWLDEMAGDPVIRTLLTLYDLLPPDPHLQAEAALEMVRPYIQSHGGDVNLLQVVGGVVHLSLSGACLGCPSFDTTLQKGISAALQKELPGFQGIEVHQPSTRRDVDD